MGIEEMGNQTYPIIHEKALGLIKEFLELKRECGSLFEKKIYSTLSPTDMVDRLVSKRPLMFMTQIDSWLAKDGTHGSAPSTGDWDSKARSDLANFLTYDEIKLAALVQLSCPTLLINSGGRDNVGRPALPDTFSEEAVYVAAVGARFEVKGRMERQDMVVTRDHNTEQSQVLALFAKFYGRTHFPSHQELVQSQDLEYVEVRPGTFFNKEVYTARLQLTAETFLIEANQRGVESDKDVYCHVVGLGLGVWQFFPQQNQLFLRAWVRTLDSLINQLGRVKDVNFSWVASSKEVPELENGNSFGDTNIKIHFSRREPFQKLCGEDKDKLTVAMFAWDGNSYVGNEYWSGLLSASGDPAAACCSLIPELLNPDINPKVGGSNLHIASRELGLISYLNYVDHHSSTT